MPIYLDTEAMSLRDIYIVKLVVAKNYRNASAYQSQFFLHCSPSPFLRAVAIYLYVLSSWEFVGSLLSLALSLIL